MSEKIILIDIDGCVLDWLPAFRDFMSKQGDNFNKQPSNSYNLGVHYNMKDEEIYKKVEEFNSSAWQFGALDPLPGAKEGLACLNSLGYTFVGITSCSDQPMSYKLRRANLYNHFGDVFDEVFCIALRANKSNWLERYEPTFWIEDKTTNCIDGLQFGHTCLLKTRIWNQNDDHPDIIRCDTWGEIVKIISGKELEIHDFPTEFV